jgi:hypothetical protein
MKSLSEFIAIAEFLGEDMSEEQTTRLMDEAKSELSHADIEKLSGHVTGPLYTDLSEYYGECGVIPGFSR